MDTTKKAKKSKNRYCCVCAALAFFAFYINLDVFETDNSSLGQFVLNLSGSFRGFSFLYLLLFPMLFLLFSWIEQRAGDEKVSASVRLPAALFAGFLVFGYSFQELDNWSLVLTIRNGQIIKALVVFAGYYCLFVYLIRLFYHFLDNIPTQCRGVSVPRPIRKYCQWLKRNPFGTAWVTLLLVYIPCAVVSYPGIFMGDTDDQIVQAFPGLHDPGVSYLRGRTLSDTVFLNSHHPVTHTLLLHGCVILGQSLFHTGNAGILLYSLIQWGMVITAIACAVKMMLSDMHIPVGYGLLCLCYFIISPVIQNYMFLITKDVLYGVFLLYFLIGLYDLCVNGKTGVHAAICIPLSLAGLLLFRNDARYILLVSLILLAIFYGQLRRPACIMLSAVLCFSLFYPLLMTALDITPGSRREMFSVPFQQTARYIRDYPEDVTAKERAAIDQVLDYDVLAEYYKPKGTSDDVKNTFREDATGQELLRYFAVWFEMLRKHPGPYLQSPMNSYYEYFYPGKTINRYSYNRSVKRMGGTNERLSPLKIQFSHPHKLAYYRESYERLRNACTGFLPITILCLPSSYSWLLILLAAYSIRNRCKPALAMLTVPCILLLFCLLGPTNGTYGRYVYPLILCMPFLSATVIHLNKSCNSM